MSPERGVTSTAPLRAVEVELLIAGAWVEPSDARREELTRAARAVERWPTMIVALERHGLLGLLARNLSGVELPAAARAGLEERAEALREDARRFRFTLERFLRAAEEQGIRPTLLKGASLTLDAYPDPSLRGQGDLDLLVEPDEVEAATRAGERAGLLMDASSLPAWWYRRAHFHLKLAPGSALLREVEVHWALHHPSLLLTPDRKAMKARRRETSVGGAPAWDLDRVDRLVHLVTHLDSHAPGIGQGGGAGWLRSSLQDPAHALRLKWVVDLRTELECWGADLPLDAIVDRTIEWGAVRSMAATLSEIREGLGLDGQADAAVAGLLERLRERIRAHRVEGPIESSRVPGGDSGRGPLPALDFRAAALGRLPRWFWPPAEYLSRRYGRDPTRRARHATAVGTRAAATALLLPLAYAGRRVLAPGRRRAKQAMADPEFVLELVSDWRRATRADRRDAG